MKASLFIIALSVLSISAHAIPPVPPSPTKIEPSVVRCVDFNSLTSDELADLEDHTDKIISLDEESREICYKY